MPLAHADHGIAGAWPYAMVVAVGYLTLALHRRHDPRGWSAWRTVAFLAGSIVLAVGLTPRLLPFPAGDVRGHMLQHLLVGMVAPLGLVLGAPVTLVLRSVTIPRARRISRVLRSRPLHVVANPVVALVLNVGGMVVLYVTPLYRMTTADPVAHQLVQPALPRRGLPVHLGDRESGPRAAAAVGAGPPGGARRRRRRPLDRRAAAVRGACSPRSPSRSTSSAVARHSCTTAATSPSSCWPSRWSAPGGPPPGGPAATQPLRDGTGASGGPRG